MEILALFIAGDKVIILFLCFSQWRCGVEMGFYYLNMPHYKKPYGNQTGVENDSQQVQTWTWLLSKYLLKQIDASKNTQHKAYVALLVHLGD